MSAAFLFCVLALGSCEGKARPYPPYAIAVQQKPVYRLRAGDTLRIEVAGERRLSGEYRLSNTGTIAMALVGEVPAVGLSTRELEGVLTERFKRGFLREPGISVQLAGYRPFFVYGEVANPGEFQTRESMTLQAAIASAGGFTSRADRKTVSIRRAATNRDYRVKADTPVVVAPGDVILVAPRRGLPPWRRR